MKASSTKSTIQQSIESEDDIDQWMQDEEESTSDDEVDEASQPTLPIPTLESIEERYVKSQLRIIRSNADFTLHNLRISLSDPSYIDFSPIYQRRDRWDSRKRSLLIESLLMNIPVPPIFLYENKYNQYEVMDGRQRLESIRDYLNDGFNLRGLEYWKELNGISFSKLPATIRNGLLRRTISATVLNAETSAQKDAAVDVRMALFERLNTGGIKLNKQELRNALFPGEFNQMLIRAARAPIFTRIWGIPPYMPGEEDAIPVTLQKNAMYRTMGDCELVLRFFAIRQMVQSNQTGTLRTVLDKYMEAHQADTRKEVDALEAEFLLSLAALDSIFEGKPFILPTTDRPSHVLYDSLMVAYSLGGKSNLKPTGDIRSDLASALEDEVTYSIIVNRYNTSESIAERVEISHRVLFD